MINLKTPHDWQRWITVYDDMEAEAAIIDQLRQGQSVFCLAPSPEVRESVLRGVTDGITSGGNVSIVRRQNELIITSASVDIGDMRRLDDTRHTVGFAGSGTIEHVRAGGRLVCEHEQSRAAEQFGRGRDTRQWVLVCIPHHPNRGRKPTMQTAESVQISPDSPLDGAITKAIIKAAGTNRGFVLDLMHTLGEDTREDLQELKAAARQQIEAGQKLAELMAKEDRTDEDDAQIEVLTDLVSQTSTSVANLLDVLDIDSGHKAIEVRQSLPPIDDTVPPIDYRAHNAYTIASLAEMMLTMGDDRGGVAYVGVDGITGVLNEWADRGDVETVRMDLNRSDIFASLEAAEREDGKTYDQKGLVKMLLQNKRYVQGDLAWVDEVRNLTSTTKIDTEAGVQRIENKQQVTITTKAGAGALKVPNAITMRVPVLQIDDTEANQGRWAEIEVMVDIELPRPAEGVTSFGITLMPIGTDAAARQRLEAVTTEVEKAIADARVQLAELPAWEDDQHTRILVVRGEPRHQQRTLGWEAFSARRR